MFFLAFRHLTSRRKQTLITLSGVSLGTMAFVAFSGIMTGFQDFIIDQLVNNDAHVKISAKEDFVEEHSFDNILFSEKEKVFWITPPSGKKNASKIEHPLGWFERLQNDPLVQGFAPQFLSEVIFSKGGSTLTGRFTGIKPSQQIQVSNINKYMIKGNLEDIGQSGNKIVIGDGMLKKLGARFDDSISISSSKGSSIPFKIVGIFHLGVNTLDDGMAFGALADVQNINERPSEITGISIRLTDVSKAREFANEHSWMTNDKVESWDQANANILSVFSIQDFIRHFVTISIMIVAGFGIYNILNIMVNQKRREIGILRSIGYTGKDIENLFMIQGITLGVAGGGIGLLVGFLMCQYLQTLNIHGMVDHLIVSFSPQIYLLGFSIAVFSSLVSSYLPARAAGKLEPIDIVRSGE